MKAVLGDEGPLLSLMRLLTALSPASLQRRFVDDAALPPDPNALPVLIELAMNGAQRPSAIADKLHVSPPTATRLVQRLEGAGLVARQADASDGRAHLVTLSPAGRELVTGVLAQGERLMTQALETWTPAERDALAPTLARLTDDFLRQVDGSTDDTTPITKEGPR